MHGTICTVGREKTWGFVETDRGTTIFFERRSFKGEPGQLRAGVDVQFEIKLSRYRGKTTPRAVKIKPQPSPPVEPDEVVGF
jgi:cold shock CspA family protein